MKLLNILFFCLFTTSSAIAGPGAHGPNGEHLDAPAGSGVADTVPRIETVTESFELVGRLQGNELSILIDRYATNEPVLDGKLEVESNGITASAKFHADHGDYAVDDEKFIQALSKPGKHPLVFTLVARNENDLLEATMEVKGGDIDHGHPHDKVHSHAFSLKAWAIGGVVTALILAAIAIALARRKSSTGN